MTLTIEKTWTCDYRQCEEIRNEKAVGRRGEQPNLYGEIPKNAGWVKIRVEGGGMRSETLHFCCQDHAEKEMNLLTQQGLERPEPQRTLGSGT